MEEEKCKKCQMDWGKISWGHATISRLLHSKRDIDLVS